MLLNGWVSFVMLQFFLPDTPSEGITAGGRLNLLGFCLFECCVGVFWPSIMKMRSQYIPEESRSTIMNFFRIPLNIFVCVVLYNVSKVLHFLFQLDGRRVETEWFCRYCSIMSSVDGCIKYLMQPICVCCR